MSKNSIVVNKDMVMNKGVLIYARQRQLSLSNLARRGWITGEFSATLF